MPNALAERNLKVLEGRFPEFVRAAFTDKDVAFPRIEGGRIENILCGGDRPIYPEPLDRWLPRQLADFQRRPTRVALTPNHCNLSPVTKHLMREMSDFLAANTGGQSFAPAPIRETGFMFLFGIGAGLHLPAFAGSGLARHLVVIEPRPGLFRLSMGLVDWEEVFRLCEANGTGLELMVGLSPGEAAERVNRLLTEEGNLFLDGSFLFTHHDAPGMRDTLDAVMAVLPGHYKTVGFFEDEILMARNTHGNLRRGEAVSIISDEGFPDLDIPVLVVGSGPSLDADLDAIGRLAGRAFVVSCGSSLGILLGKGIHPDFHVETENYRQVVDNLETFRGVGDFGGITFVSSTTVNPEAGRMFERQWCYFRPGGCASELFLGSAKPVHGVTPLVANAAIAALAAVGFRRFVLFGVDCGRRAGRDHHARDAIYLREGYSDQEGLDIIARQEEFEVPGNFGGPILTTEMFNMSRLALERFQALNRLDMTNCSDGVRIAGAEPLRASQIALGAAQADKRAVLRGIEERLRRADRVWEGAAGTLRDAWEASRDLGPRLGDFLRGLPSEGASFRMVKERLDGFLAEAGSAGRLLTSFSGGSLQSMLRLGIFFGNRIQDGGEAERFHAFFRDRYAHWLDRIHDETRGLVADMVEGRETARPLSDLFNDGSGYMR